VLPVFRINPIFIGNVHNGTVSGIREQSGQFAAPDQCIVYLIFAAQSDDRFLICRNSRFHSKSCIPMVDSIWLWVGFNVFVLAMLALDLGVFHRSAHTVSAKEAAVWSVASGAGRYVLSMLPIF
jgi:hypothetical protein